MPLWSFFSVVMFSLYVNWEYERKGSRNNNRREEKGHCHLWILNRQKKRERNQENPQKVLMYLISTLYFYHSFSFSIATDACYCVCQLNRPYIRIYLKPQTNITLLTSTYECRQRACLCIHIISIQIYFMGTQITNPKYIIHYPDTHHNHGLISTSIGLNMRISPQYFEQNIMSIKCVASISPVIWSGNKETIIQQQGLQQFEIPLPSIDTREAMFLGKKLTFICQIKIR